MNRHQHNSARLTASAATVSVAVFISRILGLIREQVFAFMFGAGYAYDAFVVAFRIPNLLRDLFAEGALSAAFVTVFSDYDANRGREQTWQLASQVLCFITIIVSLITLLAILFAGEIVSLLAGGYGSVEGKIELTTTLTRIMMPFLLFISLAAVVMGILNTKGRFFVPALASSFFNLGSIVGGTTLALILPRYGHEAIMGMAFGTLLGGILQLAVQLPSLRATGFRFKLRLVPVDPGLRRVLLLMVPAVIGLSATQINILINTQFAASCAEGSVSWLQYAFRLVQLPIGMFGVAISIASLPLLAKQASQNKIDELRQTFVSALTMVMALCLPASIGLIILAEPIIAVIFEHGAFTSADTRATAMALSLYAVGLFGYAANKVVVPVFYAIKAPRFPVIASFIAIAVNLTIVLMTIDRLQHLALALSVSITMTLNSLLLVTILYLKIGGFSVRYLVTSGIKIAGAVALMGGGVVLAKEVALETLSQSTLWGAVSLAVVIIAALLFYITILHLIKLEEVMMLVTRIRSRFGR